MDDLLSKNPFGIVPCYDFMPIKIVDQGNLCVIFNTVNRVSIFFKILMKEL
jgi:hypothetical protein